MSTATISPRQLTATIVVCASDAKETWRASWSASLGRYLICDATADDVEIQAALTAATGGRVLLLEGTYNCVANLLVPASTTLEGQGFGTILSFSGAAITQAITINGDNVHVKNLKAVLVAGAGAGGSRPNVIYANTRTLLWLESLWLVGDTTVGDDGSDLRQAGVCFSTCTYSKVVNCQIQNNRRYSISLSACTFNAITGNTCQANTIHGIFVNNSSHYNAITGNVCQGNSDTGIYLYSSNYNAITGNTCQANDYGIWLSGSQGNAITGNACRDNLDRGISLNANAMNTPSSKNAVTGNNCYKNPSYNIYIFRSSYCVITGNSCTDGGDGIRVEGDGTVSSNYNTITGNVCTGNSSDGVEIAGGANANKNIVLGNELQGNTGLALNDGGTNTDAWKQYSDLFMDVLALTANYVVAAQDLTAAPPIACVIAAQPDVPRNITIAITDGDASISAFQIDVVGVNAKGQAATEQFLFAGGLTQTGNVAWATITSVTVTSITGDNAGDVLNVGIGIKLGLSNEIYATSDVYKIKKNAANALVAVAQVNATYDTYDMSVITLAATDDFTIWYKSNLNRLA